MRTTFLAVTTLLISIPALAGGWSSSGGSGIVCFKTREASKAAAALASKNLPLTDALRAQATSVEALDVWDNLDWLAFDRVRGWTREKILADLHAFLALRAPLFESRLKLAEDRIALVQWAEDSEIAPIADSNVRRVKDLKARPLCQKIQLARRTERSREGLLPEAYVSVDKALFDKMDALNQAALFAHETFYLFGRDYGPKQVVHENSDKIRRLVAVFLSDSFRRDLSRAPQVSEEADVVQKLINDLYGDYYLYFDQEGAFAVKVPAGRLNQATRHASFGSILKKLRAQIDKCPDGEPNTPMTAARKACMDSVMDPRKNFKIMSDEEAFVFFTRWILDQDRGQPNPTDGSEHLLVWDEGSNGEPNAYQKDQLRRACRATHDRDYQLLKGLQGKSKQYCDKLGL